MLRSVNPKPAFFCIEEESDLGRDRQRKGDRYASGMEMEEMGMQARKRWRLGNGRDGGKVDDNDDEDDGEGEEEEEEEEEGVGGVEKEEKGRVFTWNPSRIIRASRGSGGKDRHSKVLTSKGLRDRRVRLSVPTAIQFYDLQDRLGCDQPSKAVDWLIQAAADAIAELPSLDGAFQASPKQASNERRYEPDAEIEPSNYLHQHTQPQQQMLSSSKSGCSSNNSETSKGSVLSLSRSESRVKARERARERTAKEKEKESNIPQSPNPSASFTNLLTSCNGNTSEATIPTAASHYSNPSFIPKQFLQYFPSMDYFGPAVIFGDGKTHQSSGFSSHSHFGNPTVSSLPPNIMASTAGDHPELQQFALWQDHVIPVAAAASTENDHNLNFSISSSLTGFNRGTLQSNSPSSLFPHAQKFPAPVVEAPPNVPLFIGTAADNQFLSAFDGRLQLCYGDGCRHSDLKGKGKS
ncbi:hypothetical protein AAC387_Pa05g3581 [Persea americana]